jgi:DNA repair exonuclease SbcCD nuclease subunit
MLRLLHTADVHLGARHADLGEQASAQRGRQFDAFRRAVDLALEERVDLFLVAGDLFDSNTQPRRTVDRVAAEFRRLAQAAVRVVIIPGTHDVYDRSSVYRTYDLAAMAGVPPMSDMLVVLTPDRPEVVLPTVDAIVYGRVFATKRAPQSPLAGFDGRAEDGPTWRIGMIHGALSIPGMTDGDDVVIDADEIAASHLDYLALGHWHSTLTARAGDVQYAYPGAPEPVAVNQDRAGNVLLVTFDMVDGARTVTVQERPVGRTRFEHVDVDAAEIRDQAALLERLLQHADADLVLDVRLTGVRADELELDADDVESSLAPSFHKVRIRDVSVPPLSSGPLPTADTISGAFIRDVEGRIADLERNGAADDARELRDVLRLGRLLLSGQEVTL